MCMAAKQLMPPPYPDDSSMVVDRRRYQSPFRSGLLAAVRAPRYRTRTGSSGLKECTCWSMAHIPICFCPQVSSWRWIVPIGHP